MSAFEDRLAVEGREVATRGRDGADTDAAWRALQGGEGRAGARDVRRPNRAWIATAAAGLLVLGGLVSTLFLGGGDGDPGVAAPGVVSSTEPTTQDATGPTTAAEGSGDSTAPSATSDTAPAATDTQAPVDTITQSFPPDRPCTYTDPAQRPITVARALTCPDGTGVWVRGVVVRVGERRYLCDHVAGVEDVPCEGATLELVGDGGPVNGGYNGIKDGGELRLTGGSLPLPDPVPTAP